MYSRPYLLLLRCTAAAIVIVLLEGSEHPRKGTPGNISSDLAIESIKVPLLPVIFFDSASSDIPERYDLEPLPAGTSSVLYRNYHDAYLRVLDVLAEQLLTSPMDVVLHGYEERTGGVDECYLARSRAERVRNYLVYDRGVDARRIRVNHSNVGCLPPEISAKGGSRLSCEYRRVEILSSNGDPFPIWLRTPMQSPLALLMRESGVVLFDLRSEYIRRSHRRTLTLYLQQLPPESELRLTGHTDVMGRSEDRFSLGAQRALGVATIIREQRPDCRIRMLNISPSRRPPLGLPAVDLPEIRYMSRSAIVQRISTSTR